MLVAKKVLFPGAGKKLEMEEMELAERLCEHIWLASGYLPALLGPWLAAALGSGVGFALPCPQGNTSLETGAVIGSWLRATDHE